MTLHFWLIAPAVFLLWACILAFCLRGAGVAKRGDYWVGDDDEAECLDALAPKRGGHSIMRAMDDYGTGARR